MRKRDREKIVKNIELGIESKQGRPISVRPYEEDHKKLEEIAAETGESKSAIVRRMIHFALTDRHQHFASGRCQEKLDWLVRTGRQNETIDLAVSDNIGEIRESIDRMESEIENSLQLLRQASSLTTEIYSMSSMSTSSRRAAPSVPSNSKSMRLMRGNPAFSIAGRADRALLLGLCERPCSMRRRAPSMARFPEYPVGAPCPS